MRPCAMAALGTPSTRATPVLRPAPRPAGAVLSGRRLARLRATPCPVPCRQRTAHARASDERRVPNSQGQAGSGAGGGAAATDPLLLPPALQRRQTGSGAGSSGDGSAPRLPEGASTDLGVLYARFLKVWGGAWGPHGGGGGVGGDGPVGLR
jgi:hypothetical protein